MSEYFKIIRQFIKCHAGEGDAISARQAVEAITPAAENALRNKKFRDFER